MICGLRAIRTFVRTLAGGFAFMVGGGNGVLPSLFLYDIGGNLFWLRLFEFETLEIRRGDLECVEHEAGGFPFESLLQNHLHGLSNDRLDGVRIFKIR